MTEGYDYEMHSVTTEDGYILKLHRIATKKSDNIKRAPVLLMHGLFGTASDYLILGRHGALAYLLFDSKYDVWMGNSRGTDYSFRHRKYSANSSEFWNFSFHEIGVFDLSAMIDYILKTTKHTSMFFVGHSQGSTVMLVLLSTMPEYNKKINQAHLMAPASFMKHPHPLAQMLAPSFDVNLI